MALCKIQIIGNVGKDPEMKYTPSGKAVTSFSVAVNQSTKNNQTGEWDEATDWFRVQVWGDRGERVAEDLRKGNRVFIGGRFKTREWQSQQDGEKHVSMEITADDVYNLSKTKADAEGGGSAPAPRDRAADDDIDDLPF